MKHAVAWGLLLAIASVAGSHAAEPTKENEKTGSKWRPLTERDLRLFEGQWRGTAKLGKTTVTYQHVRVMSNRQFGVGTESWDYTLVADKKKLSFPILLNGFIEAYSEPYFGCVRKGRFHWEQPSRKSKKIYDKIWPWGFQASFDARVFIKRTSKDALEIKIDDCRLLEKNATLLVQLTRLPRKQGKTGKK